MERVYFASDVDHIRVFKAANHLRNCICLADVGEKLVAQPFALRGSFDKPCDVDKRDGGIHDLFAVRLCREGIESRIEHIDDANIWIDGAKRVVF